MLYFNGQALGTFDISWSYQQYFECILQWKLKVTVLDRIMASPNMFMP